MASIDKRGTGYRVRWRDPDGTARSRTVPDYDTARALRAEVERAVSTGRRWVPVDGVAVPLMSTAIADYMAWAESHRAPGTVRQYDLALRHFYRWVRAHTRKRRPTLDLMTTRHADLWYAHMATRGLARSTCNLRATGLQSARVWLSDDEHYRHHAPPPRRRLRLPAVAWSPPSAPSWADMDAAILAAEQMATGHHSRRAGYGLRARLFTVLRFTGLRVSQAMGLRWDDLDLDGGWLTIRGELGKSRQEQAGRVVPISPHLVAELAGWGARRGYLLAPGRVSREVQSRHSRRCWDRAGVDPARCRSPHHAFRYGFTSGLKALGADTEAVEYLVGHSVAGARAHYLDPRRALSLVETVAMVPPVERGAVVRMIRGGE